MPTTPAPGSGRAGNVKQRLLFACAVLGAIVFAVLVLLILFGGPDWDEEFEAELRALRAAGGSVRLADFSPPPVPDDENGALLYEEAFADLRRLQEERGRDVDAPWEEPVDWKALSEYVEHYRPALPALREAGRKPRFRFGIAYEKGLEAEFVSPTFLHGA